MDKEDERRNCSVVRYEREGIKIGDCDHLLCKPS